MIKNHIKIAFRQLIKNKVLSSINILSLTIGLTGALVCYLVLKHQFTFDQFHTNATETYRIVQHTHTKESTDYWSTICYPLPAALREDFPAIKTTQTAGPFSRIFSVENAIGEVIRFEEDHVLFVDKYYLSFFDFQHHFPKDQDIWLVGDRATAFDNPSSIVITWYAFSGQTNEIIRGRRYGLRAGEYCDHQYSKSKFRDVGAFQNTIASQSEY